jgi:hypothetical protein
MTLRSICHSGRVSEKVHVSEQDQTSLLPDKITVSHSFLKSGYFGALSDKSQLFVRRPLVLYVYVYNSRNQWVPHVHTYTVFQY